MPLKLQPGPAYLLPASTSFTLVRPLPRLLLPVLRLNPPTFRSVDWGKVKIVGIVHRPPRLSARVPLSWLIHRLRGWPKVYIMGIINHDRDANAPTASEPAGVVEIPAELAPRCRYRGEMMMIEDRVCAVFVDPDFVCRYAQAVP